MVMFSQAADKFNQVSWLDKIHTKYSHKGILYYSAICQIDFGTDQQIKQLSCGHLFHSDCVAHWLSITLICPVCHQNIRSQRL